MRADFVFTCTAAQAPFAMAIARNASSMFLGEDQTRKKNPPLGAKAAVVSKTIPGELGRVLVRVMPEFGLDPQTKTASKDPDCVSLDLAIAFDRKGRVSGFSRMKPSLRRSSQSSSRPRSRKRPIRFSKAATGSTLSGWDALQDAHRDKQGNHDRRAQPKGRDPAPLL